MAKKKKAFKCSVRSNEPCKPLLTERESIVLMLKEVTNKKTADEILLKYDNGEVQSVGYSYDGYTKTVTVDFKQIILTK